jgi:hypothetical protein
MSASKNLHRSDGFANRSAGKIHRSGGFEHRKNGQKI